MPTMPRPAVSQGTAFEKLTLRAASRFKRLAAAPGADFFDHQLWEHAHDNQIGVIAWDPDGHKCGLNVCTSSWFKSYVPFDRYKQTLVGEMLDYGFYDGSGDEADWNIFVDPDPAFGFILDDVVQVMDETDELQTVNGRIVVECEITPDEVFYDNAYFTRTAHRSQNIGKRIGLYGPWVRDGGHDGRPEIHPCEIIWWHDPPTARAVAKWTLLVVQDDSNRFDRKADFSGRVPRGWSQPPRRAAFAVALELNADFAYRYRLSIRRHRNMAVIGGPVTTANPADYVLSRSVPAGQGRGPGGLGGAALPPIVSIEVEKRVIQQRDLGPGDTPGTSAVAGKTIPAVPDTTSPGMLDATLSSIVRDPDRPRVFRCFLTFQVQVGTLNDRGGEGYAEIFLEELSRTDLTPGIGG
jgi:hypothetical protein